MRSRGSRTRRSGSLSSGTDPAAPGRRNFKSSDESRNVWVLSLLSFGESWHNNHHAFPSSAFHGMRRFEAALDPGGWVIAGLEKLGLAWKVVRIPREQQASKSLVA